VDAARLLLVLVRFSTDADAASLRLRCFPLRPFRRHFTPEYYLQKLDFLLRYPTYFAYELIDLHRLGVPSAASAAAVKQTVRTIIADREPQLRTQPFKKFWRGAYERIDDVEAWWYARRLVYTRLERRGQSPPQKHYFVTAEAISTAERLVRDVAHARWYAERVGIIHRYFGTLSAAEVKSLQYSHPEYRQAQIDETIPDLPLEHVYANFSAVFGEELEAIPT
jgi:hypothetical protein